MPLEFKSPSLGCFHPNDDLPPANGHRYFGRGRRKQLLLAQWWLILAYVQEYYDYIFPGEGGAAVAGTKLLDAAAKWKRQKMLAGNGE